MSKVLFLHLHHSLILQIRNLCKISQELSEISVYLHLYFERKVCFKL